MISKTTLKCFLFHLIYMYTINCADVFQQGEGREPKQNQRKMNTNVGALPDWGMTPRSLASQVKATAAGHDSRLLVYAVYCAHLIYSVDWLVCWILLNTEM